MKNILFIISLFPALLFSQTPLKGHIENYANKRVSLKINKQFSAKLIGSTETDNKGNFKFQLPENYSGVVYLSLFDAKQNIMLLADNTPITIEAKMENDSIIYKNYGNAITTEWQKKMKNPEGKIDAEEYPLLDYYIQVEKTLDSTQNYNSIEMREASKNRVVERFTNDNDYIETTDVGKGLLTNYLKICSRGSGTDRESMNRQISAGIDNLLESVGEETSRGQLILGMTIDILHSYEFDSLVEKYMKKVSSMTCEISPELKNVIDRNQNIVVGKPIPNLVFTKPLGKAKYKNLYDIKAPQKLVVVWASWCSHCVSELPELKTYYTDFKAKGGEVIGFSLDFSKEDYENATKELPWLNDTELMYWDSKIVKELNITGTPTLFLLDENNNILKITHKISDLY